MKKFPGPDSKHIRAFWLDNLEPFWGNMDCQQGPLLDLFGLKHIGSNCSFFFLLGTWGGLKPPPPPFFIFFRKCSVVSFVRKIKS